MTKQEFYDLCFAEGACEEGLKWVKTFVGTPAEMWVEMEPRYKLWVLAVICGIPEKHVHYTLSAYRYVSCYYAWEWENNEYWRTKMAEIYPWSKVVERIKELTA